MLTYLLRRILFAVPTLLFISLIIFLVLALSPSDPTASLPLSIPSDVREHIREALGFNEPIYVRYLLWLKTFLVNEPLYYFQDILGVTYDPSTHPRVISWQTRTPVMDTVIQRFPQTLWVVGLSYVIGVLIAIPIGIISAYRQYSLFDQIGTFISMIGFSVPTFFTGVLLIVIFSVLIPADSFFWLPSIYDTTHEVTDFSSFMYQVRQMIMPVFVLALYNAAQISRFMRASMLENLNQDYVRTARSKGVSESSVIFIHVLRNSLISVVTVIALGVPQIFGGAIITEQVFKVNGLGQLLIIAIQDGDAPTVQTLTFMFAILIVVFNLLADIIYGILDPRIRYD